MSDTWMSIDEAKEELDKGLVRACGIGAIGPRLVLAVGVVVDELQRLESLLGACPAPIIRYVVHGTVVREEPAQPRPQAWPCPTAHDAEWLAAKLTERLKERAS